MLIPASAILRAISEEVHRQQSAAGEGTLAGSSQQALEVGLRLLLARELGGVSAARQQQGRLSTELRLIRDMIPTSDIANEFDGALAQLAEAVSLPDLISLESAWREVLSRLERLVSDGGEVPGGQESRWRAELRVALIRWEAADLRCQLGTDLAYSDVDTSLNAVNVQNYLREYHSDPTLTVDDFRHLAGGFGKQTYLFSATGGALRGDYVLRRDLPVTPLDNDCHRIENEFAVIRAAHARGFPAPEALWLDTRHTLLPGGHFLVMRRSPGVPGGDVFSARGTAPQDLAETLGGILARLHALPPMEELATLTDSISAGRWRMPLEVCIRHYLEAWRDLYRRDQHLPSPAIASLFAWLLGNVPRVNARPVLLHGDIGFHNFLIEGTRLSAVLDWEFAHLGDPAEDIAYVRNTVGGVIDWPRFVAAYEGAGGSAVSAERVRFFQVWGHLRNAASCAIIAGKFAGGTIGDLKMVVLPHVYVPLFLTAAQAAIDSKPS